MLAHNPYELFTTDPVEFNKKFLKEKLAVALITLIRSQGWNQSVAAERLSVSQPRISNLFRGQMDKFSIDSLLEMLIRSGYKVDADFDPNNQDEPLSMKMKKAML